MDVLPWTLLARRTSFHNELQCTPAQALMGQNPRLPGDVEPQPTVDTTLQQILEKVKDVTNRPPAQTRPSTDSTYFPPAAEQATHVYVRRPKSKTGPLTPISDGPFPILERLGNSSLKIKVGEYKSKAPRTETVHWRNCVPAILDANTKPAERPKLGRKPRVLASP